jgi:hypothetical protein
MQTIKMTYGETGPFSVPLLYLPSLPPSSSVSPIFFPLLLTGIPLLPPTDEQASLGLLIDFPIENQNFSKPMTPIA